MEEGEWIRVFKYPSLEAALPAYNALAETLFGNKDITASTYRVEIGGVPYVVTVGKDTPSILTKIVTTGCFDGEEVDPGELPDDIREFLIGRSREQWKFPGYLEGHYRG